MRHAICRSAIMFALAVATAVRRPPTAQPKQPAPEALPASTGEALYAGRHQASGPVQ